MKDQLRKIRRRLLAVLGRDLAFRNDVYPQIERHGTVYGGWTIIANSLHANAVVYSVGVGDDISFDIGLIEQYGLTIHAFDPTPKSVAWIATQVISPSFIFHCCGLAALDGDISFNPPAETTHVSYTLTERPSGGQPAVVLPVKRLGTLMDELGHHCIDLLKMDIEGAEYEVLRDIEISGIRPTQMLIEFHHRFPSIGIAKTKDAVGRIRNMGYRLFYTSSSGEELSFLYVGTDDSGHLR